MTLLKAWSFDNWTDDDYNQIVSGDIIGSYLIPETDRFGTSNGAMKIGRHDFGAENHIMINHPTTNPTILGFCTKVNAGMGYSSTLGYYGGTASYYNLIISFNKNNDFMIYSYVGTTATLMFELPINVYTWHYYEIEFYPHDTNGYVDVHVDGVQVYYNDDNYLWRNDYSGYNPDGVSENIMHNYQSIMDDMYFIEVDATAPNDFLGPIHIEPITVSADGTTNNGVASAGSNYECVDEIAHNDDTDYVILDAVDEIELYTITDLSITSGTIHAVILRNICMKVGDEVKAIQGIIRVNSTNYPSGNSAYLTTEYNPNNFDVFLLNPDDAAAWEIADVNAMEAGIKITA